MRGFDDDEGFFEDMRNLGASDEQIAAAREGSTPDFEVDPENWDAFLFFYSRCATSWKRDNGIPTGLDYSGVESLARMSGVDITPPFLDKLQALEASYLGEYIKHMKRNQ